MQRNGVALLLLLMSICCLPRCSQSKAAATRPSTIRLANNARGSFARELAAEYNRAALALNIRIIEMTDASNIDAIGRGDAEIAMAPADRVYFAYRKSLQSHSSSSSRMRAIAALHVIPLHLLVRGHSEIRSVTDLRRGMVRPFSLSRMPVQELLFTALGVDPQAVARNARPLTELARLVSEWTTGVATVGYYYPSEIVQAALKRGARLLPIEGPEIERIRREYRFVRQVTIPAGTYPGYSRPIRTI